MSCHSVAVVLTLVQIKQIRINIHKRYKNTVQNSKYRYTYYPNTHTLQNKLKQPQYKFKQPQYKIRPNEVVKIQ